MDCYWTPAELQALDKAETLDEMVEIALIILERMKSTGKKIVQVCGPMTRGGLGSYEANMELFRKVVVRAHEESGYVVFNQDMFTKVILRLDAARQSPEYWHDLIDNFYGAIFRSGHFHGTLWIRQWETSTGSVREREIATECGLLMEDCPEYWYD